MEKFYLNPFALLQTANDKKVLFLTNRDDLYFEIEDSNHPLFRAENTGDILGLIPELEDADRQALIDEGVIALTRFERKQLLEDCYQKLNLTETFRLMIFPTLNCNNACSYCYQEHENQPRMELFDYNAIRALVAKKIDQGIKVLFFNIMGGEGTLVCRDLAKHIQDIRELCEESKVEFICSMTTNGRLLRKEQIARSLLDAGVKSFQITVDGPAHIHNRCRPAIDPQADSYDETLKGLLTLKKIGSQDLVCTIRCNHTLETVVEENLEEHLKSMAGHFSGDERFVFYNVMAADLGGEIDGSILVKGSERRKKLQEVNQKTVDMGLTLKQDTGLPNGRVCYAAMENSIVVMPGLKLKKCSVELNDPINDVGTLLDDGTLQLNDNLKKWIGENDVPDNKCTNCRVAPICHGKACPYKSIIKGEPVCPDVKLDGKFMIRNLSK